MMNNDYYKPVLAGGKKLCLFFVQSEEVHPICPYCKTMMHRYGRRWRTALLADGQKMSLHIRRLRCPCCQRIHHELPDFLVPYKRFIAVCIEKAIQKKANGICCENSTIYRWLKWFQALLGKFQISSLDLYKKEALPQLILLLRKVEN